MKRIFINLMVIVMALFGPLAHNSLADWSPETQVTNGPADEVAWHQKKKVAVSGNYVYVVWKDNRDWLTTGNDIWFKRSTDGGVTWENEVQLTTNDCHQFNGEIVASGNSVYVFWVDDRDGVCRSFGRDENGNAVHRTEIYYRKSTDYGVTWEPEARISYIDSTKYLSGDVAIRDANLYVVWNDFTYGVVFAMSEDGGATWLPVQSLLPLGTIDILIGDPNCDGYQGGGTYLAVSGNTIHVVWEDIRNQATSGAEVGYRRSLDNGLTWESDRLLTSLPEDQRKPVVTASGSTVLVVWEDDREIATGRGIGLAYTISFDNGETWSQPAWMAISPNSNKCDQMFAASGNTWYGVWTDTRNMATSGLDLYYKFSPDGGVTWYGGDGGIQFTSGAYNEAAGSLAAEGNVFHLVWEDNRGSFDGTNTGVNLYHSFTDSLPFLSPTNLTVVDRPNDGGGMIDLSWTPSTSTGAIEQRVYRSLTSGGPYNLIATIPDNTTSSFTDTVLVDGTTYYYILRAYDGAQESSDSNEAFATPTNELVLAPTNLTAVDPSTDLGGQLVLNWVPSVSVDVIRQLVIRGTSPGVYNDGVIAVFFDNTTATYTDTAVVDGTTYYYAVCAEDGVNEPTCSSEASATPINDSPVAPTNLTAQDPSNDLGGQLVLNWVPSVSVDVIRQLVIRGTSPGVYNDGVIAVFFDNTTATYTDTAVVDGTTYYYAVCAEDGVNEPTCSSEASATPSPINTPEGDNVTVSPGSGVTVTFSHVSTAGTTTVVTTSSGPTPPIGFQLGNPPTYYDINTTATYDPSINACITYDPTQFGDPTTARLFHYDGTTWVDVTTSNDTFTYVICGQVSSFSVFAIFTPLAAVDSDGDGLPDAWEIQYGLDPSDPTGNNGANGDPDGDGLTNLQEYQGGTDPTARLLFSKDGGIIGDALGTSVYNGGDVDGDGIKDVIVGAAQIPFWSVPRPWVGPGRVEVYSGATGNRLFSITGEAVGDEFGFSVSGVDVNGDGRIDIVVGAPGHDVPDPANPGSVLQDAGSVYVYLSPGPPFPYDGSALPTNSYLWRRDGTAAGDNLGHHVGSINSDVNGDGINDVIVGAPQPPISSGPSEEPPRVGGRGKVFVFSGPNGVLLYEKQGETDGQHLGICVFGIGDLDGDGRVEFIAGSPHFDAEDPLYPGTFFSNVGRAYVFRGSDGLPLYTIDNPAGPNSLDVFGSSVTGGADVDGDGVSDFVIGAQGTDPGGRVDAGSVYLFSGANGTLLHRFDGENPEDHFGGCCGAISATADVNGDGRADLVVSAAVADPGGRVDAGSVYVYGYNGSMYGLIHRFDGETAGDHIGGFEPCFCGGVANDGDLNGDGRAEVVIGAPHVDAGGLADAGRVYVYSITVDFDGDGLSNSDERNIYGTDPNNPDTDGGGVWDGDEVRAGTNPLFAGDDDSDRDGLNNNQEAVAGTNPIQSDTDGDTAGDGFEVDLGTDPLNPASLPPSWRTLSSLPGPNFDDGFGWVVRSIADLDGDGVRDIAVGAPQTGTTRPGAWGAGAVYIYSGRTRALIRTIPNPSGTEQSIFGWYMVEAGDLNNDGKSDLLVAAPFAGTTNFGFDAPGRVYVISGADGSVIRWFDGEGATDVFGWCLASIGDITGDGIPDILIPGRGTYTPSGYAGYVKLFSGADGALLGRIEDPDGPNFGGKFGHGNVFGDAVSEAGDVNVDGVPDFMVGSPFSSPDGKTYAGSVYIFSGRADLGFPLLYRFNGEHPNDVLGACCGAVDSLPDFNGDGFPELMAAAAAANPSGKIDAGSVYVYSGRDGSLLYRLDGENPEDFFGGDNCGCGPLAKVPDLDGDGISELLIGAPLVTVNGVRDVGRVYLYSGRTGNLIQKIENPDPVNLRLFGNSIDNLGDLDGDGKVEILIGSPTITFDFPLAMIETNHVVGMEGYGAVFVMTLSPPNNPPLANAGPDQTVEATSAMTRVTLDGSASSDPDGDVLSFEWRNAAGELVGTMPIIEVTLPLGRYPFTLTVADGNGGTASDEMEVTVQDTTPPTITCPADITVEATGPSGAVVNYASCSASDAVDPAPVVTCSLPSGSTFPLGTTVVTCTATDASGNSSSDSFTVTVVDTTAPVISVPANITAEATSPAGATVTYPAATATDAADPSPTVACTPASGSTFPLDGTLVTCTATDASGNSSRGSFTVTVVDTTPPVITVAQTPLPNANGWNNTDVTVSFTATDTVSSALCSPSTVTLTAEGAGQMVSTTCTDTAGNSATANLTVNIDKTRPVVSGVSDSPDPFRHHLGEVTTIRFTISDNLSSRCGVRVRIFNNSGVLVNILENTDMGCSVGGTVNSMVWDGRTSNGALAPRGQYTYRIQAADLALNPSAVQSGKTTVR